MDVLGLCLLNEHCFWRGVLAAGEHADPTDRGADGVEVLEFPI